MNPTVASKLILQEFGGQRIVFTLIISLAIAIGISVMLLERGVRIGSAQVSNQFDLVVTAPGSKIDAVLNLVYLQQETIEPLDFVHWSKVINDSRSKWASPVVKGDFVNGFPIVGVREELARHIYQQALEFTAIEQVWVGSDTPFNIGEKLQSQHGAFAEDDSHGHANYLVVAGILPTTHTPWDRAIISSVEQVWATHSLSWRTHEGRHGLPAIIGEQPTATHLLSAQDWQQLKSAPAVLAVVVKPTRLADAYALRSQYSTDQSMAFFPAEVLVRLHALMGNARDLIKLTTTVSEGLVLLGVVAGIGSWIQLLMPKFALLRALGASQHYLVVGVFLAMGWLMFWACILGVILGYLLAYPLSFGLQQFTQFPVPIKFQMQELGFAAGLFVISLALSIWPVFLLYRRSLSKAVRSL